MVHHLPVAVFLLVFLLFSPASVFATRSMSITGNKTTLLGDEELTLTASASGFTDGETIYIKGAFFQSGPTNYFGYTKSADTWIKNSAGNTSQRSVKIGDWDGTLIVKSDFNDSGYKGEGDYSLKLGFYYGSYTSVNWSSNTLGVTINEPDPTPTNTPTPTLTPTPTQAPPTPTKTPTPTLILPTKIPTPALSKTVTTSALLATDGAVLGATPVISLTPVATASSRSFLPAAIALALIGTGLAILAIVFIWKKRHADLSEKDG